MVRDVLLHFLEAGYRIRSDRTLKSRLEASLQDRRQRVDLSKIGALASAISALSDELRNKLPQEINNIRRARQSHELFAPGYGLNGIDFGRFCEKLANITADQQIISKATLARSLLKDAVISNYAGALRQEPYGYGSNGLAIYFPESKTLYEADPDHRGYEKQNTDHQVDFVHNEHWSDFLQAYLAMAQ